MGTFQSFRKAYGALKDSTKVGLIKVNSEFKDLDIATVKATSHVEYPPKERHVRKIFSATSVTRPRADVAYCIHALAKRLSKTRSWIVAIKTLIVIHRTLREGDPTFREELLNYSQRGHILQISNFKDDSSPLAWDCSAWVRTYALFLEERLECFRVLKYDIEAERLTKTSPGSTKVHSRTRTLGADELLEQLPALQQLLFRLMGCQPEGTAYNNYLIQYALALILKESFKIYCAINDGIINLVDMFFDMSRYDAVKALNIYKRAGQQAEGLADFYEYCKGLDLARTFQFPTLRQPPPSFLATMEEYIKEAPQSGSVNRRLEYQVTDEQPQRPEEPPPPEPEKQDEKVEEPLPKTEEEPQPKEEEVEPPPLISTDDTDLLGLREINPKAAEIEESNALALAIVPQGSEQKPGACFNDFAGTSGWELALVTTPSNHTSQAPIDRKLAGGFDKLLLDSLYEDEGARRQLQLQNAGYGYGATSLQNPFEQQTQQPVQDPFAMSNSVAPPTNVQMALMAQQQHEHQQIMQQQQQQYQQQQNMMVVPHPYYSQYSQPMQPAGSSNPFGDPFSFPPSTTSHQGNQNLI
ncbi:putative clathrin assembly protein At5g57200 [Pyrus x bretschneideri]|uniref:putative clathrin assembly protein At5g57200 n=1 Tax=Pyrus x bretschneideri TaxID=225117 RepID=UPI002030BADF|nr:putative clathrin assembly protein At5g57200 [Pyrus x bretschneideri]